MRILSILSLLLLPGIVLAAPRTLHELAALFVTFINAGIGVALVAGIVIYFYGIATSIPKASSGDIDRLRAHMIWGIIALFVMFSVWGILALLRNTLFGGGSGAYGTDSGSFEIECETFEDCM